MLPILLLSAAYAALPAFPDTPLRVVAAAVLLALTPLVCARSSQGHWLRRTLVLALPGAALFTSTFLPALDMTNLPLPERAALGAWPLLLHLLISLPLALTRPRTPLHWAGALVLTDVIASHEALWGSGTDPSTAALAFPLHAAALWGTTTASSALLLLSGLMLSLPARPGVRLMASLALAAVLTLTLELTRPAPGAGTYPVQIVQGGERWEAGRAAPTPQESSAHVTALSRLIRPAALTLLPEQAYPDPRLSGLAPERPLPFPAGTVYGAVERTSLHEYNAAFVVGRNRSVRRKAYLVPFQESRWLTPGHNPAPDVHRMGTVKYTVRICLEGMYSHTLRQARQAGAALLLVPSNTTRARLITFQTLAVQAAAAANGMVSVVSNERGLSSVHDGNLTLARLPWGTAGQATVKINLTRPLTPFTRFGDVPLWLLAGAALLSKRRARRIHSNYPGCPPRLLTVNVQ